jgi:pSer/pThr/pTyr-binding forkhead associated (FHA) protein
VELLISARSEANGELSSVRFSLDGAVTLGRGTEGPLLLDGNGISREHLRLHSEGDGILVTDLSSNGTWLNTTRLKRGEPRLLAPADAIRIPGFEIRIELPNTSAKPIPQDTAVPERTRQPLDFARTFAASFSRIEKVLIALALATLLLAAVYLFA